MALHHLYSYRWLGFSTYVTFWARCLYQRLAYSHSGHDWKLSHFYDFCNDLVVHTGTISNKHQVKIFLKMSKNLGANRSSECRSYWYLVSTNNFREILNLHVPRRALVPLDIAMVSKPFWGPVRSLAWVDKRCYFLSY